MVWEMKYFGVGGKGTWEMGLEREKGLLHELIFMAREYGVGSYINEKSLEGFTSFVETYHKK